MTHGRPKLVILRSPALWDDEGSPQFAGNIHPSADGLAVQRNCRDSSAPKERGPQNDIEPDCGGGAGRARSQRSGTRTTIASFTRAISEENESLPTSFIGWTRAVKGFTVTRSLACGSRDAWKETTQSGRPSPSRSIGSEMVAGSAETGFHTICTNDAVGESGARFKTGL